MELAQAIKRAKAPFTTVPALLETTIRLMQLKLLTRDETESKIRRFNAGLRIDVRPISRDMLAMAIDAFDRFGKGRHPAALNFGDCLAYAAAKHHRALLIYKGDDFARTDVNDGY
jgi:ribonuclease VapC